MPYADPAQRARYYKEWQDKNRETVRQHNRDWYARNKETRLLAIKSYRKANPETQREINKKKRLRHPERHKAYQTKWRLKNLHKDAAKAARRRALRRRASPPWLTDDHWKDIGLAYETAQQLKREKGIDYEVDHIVPLKGENVCGLHVPWNLQILTNSENARKKNKMVGGYDGISV